MVFAALFASLTAVGAYVKIPLPITPVPVTMQVFFVLLAGCMLGSRWGTISMIVYLLLGIAGFPVFCRRCFRIWGYFLVRLVAIS